MLCNTFLHILALNTGSDDPALAESSVECLKSVLEHAESAESLINVKDGYECTALQIAVNKSRSLEATKFVSKELTNS